VTTEASLADRLALVEEELAEMHRKLVEAQQLARIGSWEWDIPTNVVWWSDELYRIYGLEPRSIVPSYEEFLAYVHPDDRDAVDERNRTAFADHEPFEDVKRVVRADGREILMRTQGEVICDTGSQPLRMVGICEDVTDQVRAREAERELAAAEALRHRAAEINDEIVQRLVLASAMLAQDERERARANIDETLARAKRIAADLLLKAETVRPGDLRRATPAA
jgi:PAS domain S-box-containing protein